jgi:hypothetical protein
MEIGQEMPDLLLHGTDGSSIELADLRESHHGLLIMADRWLDTVKAFTSHFQDNARTFDHMGLKLVVAFKAPDFVPTPWPAPAYVARVAPRDLPPDIEWGQAYLFCPQGLLREVYKELDLLAVSQVERDLTRLKKLRELK